MAKKQHTPATSKEKKQYAMLIHLAQFAGYIIPLGGWLLPFILWRMKRKESKYIDIHGKIAMNWILSCLFYTTMGVLLCYIFIGYIILAILAICSIVFPIMAALKAKEGRIWRYPLNIRFLK